MGSITGWGTKILHATERPGLGIATAEAHALQRKDPYDKDSARN